MKVLLIVLYMGYSSLSVETRNMNSMKGCLEAKVVIESAYSNIKDERKPKVFCIEDTE
jgi:hypothetical protein